MINNLKADFLITGVMKGGTTILYDFLSLHPEINKSLKKEIHYFSLNYELGDSWYESHFLNNGLLNGEASPTYFDLATTKLIPSMINRHNPHCKIIVILRDPVERAISHFNHLVKINKNQNLNSIGIERFFNYPFSKSVVASDEISSLLYHVLNFSCYFQKLNIYRSQFGSRLMVLKNEELRNSPYETMQKVYDFLGVNSEFSSSEFENVRYSSGTNLGQISQETEYKLREFFAEDISSTEEFLKVLK